MPSVRFSRDKRGYEYVYLVHVPTRRGKPGRSRVLYWYRTPPGVRIGRNPFDPEVRQTLERNNPGVSFDWDTIVNTPMPPPDMAEYWRERRRAEKAAKQYRRAMEAEEEVADAGADAVAGPDSSGRAATEGRTADQLAAGSAEVDPAGGSVDLSANQVDPPVSEAGAVSGELAGTTAPAGATDQPRKRRRRRGGRRRRPGTGEGPVTEAGEPAAGQEAQPQDGGPLDQSGGALDQSNEAPDTSEEE